MHIKPECSEIFKFLKWGSNMITFGVWFLQFLRGKELQGWTEFDQKKWIINMKGKRWTPSDSGASDSGFWKKKWMELLRISSDREKEITETKLIAKFHDLFWNMVLVPLLYMLNRSVILSPSSHCEVKKVFATKVRWQLWWYSNNTDALSWDLWDQIWEHSYKTDQRLVRPAKGAMGITHNIQSPLLPPA